MANTEVRTMSATETIARLRELRAKATAGGWKPVSFYRSTQLQGENFIVAGRVGVLDGSNHQQDAAAIVAAMNSLESLLNAASALDELLRCDPEHYAQAEQKARLALQALAEGGGE